MNKKSLSGPNSLRGKIKSGRYVNASVGVPAEKCEGVVSLD